MLVSKSGYCTVRCSALVKLAHYFFSLLCVPFSESTEELSLMGNFYRRARLILAALSLWQPR